MESKMYIWKLGGNSLALWMWTMTLPHLYKGWTAKLIHCSVMCTPTSAWHIQLCMKKLVIKGCKLCQFAFCDKQLGKGVH